MTILSALKRMSLFFDKILATEDFPDDREPVIPIFINLTWTPAIQATHHQPRD